MQRILIINWAEMKHGREIFRGIWDYGHAHTNWRFEMFELEKWRERLASLRGEFDGVIAALVHEELIEPVSVCTPHLVNVASHAWAAERFATVRPDNIAIGRMAAEHLLLKGFTRYAFAGKPEHGPTLSRGVGFLEALLEQEVEDLWAAGEIHELLPEKLQGVVKPADLLGLAEQTDLTRLERVKQLLCRTEWTVEEITRACGFNYPAHMTKIFREATGTTPLGVSPRRAHFPKDQNGGDRPHTRYTATQMRMDAGRLFMRSCFRVGLMADGGRRMCG
ncbi:MAG: helix-turn-helix domain-containing protein [Phycisphaerae bacterium]